MAVTGTTVPSSAKTWVIPIFLPRTPTAMMNYTSLEPNVGARLELDLNIHPRWQLQAREGIDGLGCGLQDVDETLVGSDLELLPGVLVDVGRPDDAELPDASGQGHWTRNHGPTPLCRLHNLPRRL